jgi:hypothetical protein
MLANLPSDGKETDNAAPFACALTSQYQEYQWLVHRMFQRQPGIISAFSNYFVELL